MTISWIEIVAVVFNLAYVVLAAKEHIACWIFGILGSLLSIWLFVDAKLYAESVLFSYYVIMGVYGWVAWTKGRTSNDKLEVMEGSVKLNVGLMVGGYLGTFVLFWILRTFTDAEMPLLDSFTTVFSFIATWMVAKRLLENWIYWIVIDALSVYLYLSRDLYIYTGLTFVYTFLAIYGYIEWRKDVNIKKVQAEHGI